MRAARLYGEGDLRVEEVPDPSPKAGEALVRIHASGVCPSDIRSYTGVKATKAPWTPGHEIAGVIEALGPDSPEPWAVGDRVAVDWRGVCGVCRQCQRGAANFCENVISYPIAGFADFTAMPLRQLRRLPDAVSFEAASFCEPLACVLNAHRAIPVELGADVLVVGAGPIGLLHTQVAASRGARVIVLDRLAGRLDAARTCGARDVVVAGDDDGGAAEIRELTDGYGPDAVIVTVGIPSVIQTALTMAAKDATVNLFAGTHPKGTIAVNPDIPHYDQVQINGSHDFIPHDFSTALRLLRFGVVDIAPLVSHRFDLTDITKAFETTAAQTGLKSLIVA
ncbi:zinc-dependent dehydrogenase [Phytohabitans flavus]|uniref:Alcohol dehydrogenase n=1 Tax=Phytohabitans flavus TaxID=1076124 RepID=A0A6F8XRN0_9ACTN|nr:alcohol dehydrogenase catalytic domain-containing protein [Phytohabitans flavus]BCB76502.1 alcohol dehydrogenase [Phytohabitans flavus]